MSIVVVNISNTSNSPITLGGPPYYFPIENTQQIWNLLIRSLEINRQLVSGISKEWNSDEELYTELQKLIELNKSLELQAANLLTI